MLRGDLPETGHVAQQAPVLHREIPAYVRAGLQRANHHGAQADPAAIANRHAVGDNGSGSDPHLPSDADVAVDDGAMADERSWADLHVMGHKGVVADTGLAPNAGRLPKNPARNRRL